MKLHLPNNLLAAILAAAAPVLCSTLSTATMGAAAVAAAGMSASATDYNTKQTISTNTSQTGSYAYNAGLELLSDWTISYTAAGYSQVYINGLSGTGKLALSRNFSGGDKVCYIGIAGDTAGYTGAISVTADSFYSNNRPNVLLCLGSTDASVDLSSAQSVTLGKAQLALLNDAIVNNLTVQAGTTINTVSQGHTTPSSSYHLTVTDQPLGLETDDNVTRTLTLKGVSSITSSTLTGGVRLYVADASTLNLSGNLSMAAGAISGKGTVNVASGTTFANVDIASYSQDTMGFGKESFNLVAESSRDTLSVTTGEGFEYDKETGTVMCAGYSDIFFVTNGATANATTVSTEAGRLGKSSYTTSVQSGGTYSVNSTFDAANSGVTFYDGATLKLENGAKVSSQLVRANATDDALTLVVADNATASWAANARVTSGKGIQTVNVGAGATFTVGNNEGRYNVFNNSQDSVFTLNMAAGSKVIATNSLVGWNTGNIGRQLVNIDKDAVLQLGSGTETARLNHWFNSTVYALNGGSIDIKANNYLCFERNNGGVDNSIGTTAKAEKMSTITGDGFIEMGNNSGRTNVTVDGVTYRGYKFDVQRGTFTFDETNTADLRISANFRDGTSSYDLLKTGNGILELTQANSAYTSAIDVTAGGLRLTNANARAKVNLVSGATLDLQNGAGLGESTLNGTVTSSGAITVTGAVTLGSSVRFDMANWSHETADRYNIFSTTNASYLDSFSSLSSANFVSGADTSAFDGWVLTQESVGETTYFYITSASGNLVWHGTEESHTWSGANWGNHETISGANGAVLDSTAEYKTVTLTGAATAASISVQDNYTIEVQDGVNSVVSGALTVADGYTMTKTGTGTLSVAKANLSGKVGVNEGTLALGSAGSGNVDLTNITGSGTLAVALDGTTSSQGTFSTLLLSDEFTGTLSFSGNLSTKTDFKNTSSLYLQNGANLLTPDSTSSLTVTISQNIIVADNANVALSAWGNTSTTATTLLTGALSGGSGTTLWKEDGGTTTLTGDYTGFTGTYNLHGGVLALDAGTAGKTIDNTISGTATLRKLGSGVLTLTSDMGSFTGTLNIAEGDVAISGTRRMAANVTGSGILVVGSNSHLKANKAGEQSFGNVILKGDGKLEDNSAGESRVRNITNLTVIGNASLEQESWNTLWHITNLNKDAEQEAGTLAWNMDTNHWSNSVLYLDGSGTFDGTLTANRVSGDTGNGSYQAYVQINNSDALKYAVLNLNGSNAQHIVSLALHADTVNMAGLRGTEHSIVFVGEADASQGSSSSKRGTIAPASADGQTSTLTLNAGEGQSFNYQGKILSGVSIQKDGAGEQKLTGDLSAFDGDLAINAGTLTITGTTLPQADEGTRGSLVLNGGTLKVGSGEGAQTSLSSFSSVAMAGGMLYYNNKQDTLHSVTAATGTTSRIFSFDMGSQDNGCKLTLAGTTTLNGNLTIQNYWNADFVVEKLTGAGTFTQTGADESGNIATSTAQDGTLTINSLAGFTGNLDFNSTGARATVNTGAAAVTMGALSVHHNAQVTINAYEGEGGSGTLSGSDLNLDGTSSLTFNGGTNTFTKMGVANDGANDANITINLTNGSVLKITGDTKFAAHGEKVTVDGSSKLQLDTAGVTIESIDGTQVATMSIPVGTYTNNYYTYKTDHEKYHVENAKASYSKGGTVGNVLTNTEVANIGSSALAVTNANNTLTAVEAAAGGITVQNAASSRETLKSIKAEGGDVTLTGLGDGTQLGGTHLSLDKLVISDGRTVTALTSAAAGDNLDSYVASIEIAAQGTLSVGSGTTLNANLTMKGGSTLDISGAGTDTEDALNLGCTLTLERGETITLSSEQVDFFHEYNYLVLATGVDSLTLFDDQGTAVTTTESFDINAGNDATLYFTNLDTLLNSGEDATYYLTYTGALNGGTVCISAPAVPEPTTSTLSLLALAGLMARRRRK